MGDAIALEYEVPDNHVLTYKIFPEKGALMTMDSVGRQLSLLSKILCRRDVGDSRKWEAMLQCIDTSADGCISFTVIVAARKSDHVESPGLKESDQ